MWLTKVSRPSVIKRKPLYLTTLSVRILPTWLIRISSLTSWKRRQQMKRRHLKLYKIWIDGTWTDGRSINGRDLLTLCSILIWFSIEVSFPRARIWKTQYYLCKWIRMTDVIRWRLWWVNLVSAGPSFKWCWLQIWSRKAKRSITSYKQDSLTSPRTKILVSSWQAVVSSTFSWILQVRFMPF